MLKEAGLVAITVAGLVTKLEAEACWFGVTWAGGWKRKVWSTSVMSEVLYRY
jgi:hypothetical protein